MFEKFKSNLVYWYQYATAWVSAIWFGVLAWWGSLDKAGQIDLVGSFLPPHAVSALLAGLAIASYIAAKGWPQPVLKAKVEAKQAQADTPVIS